MFLLIFSLKHSSPTSGSGCRSFLADGEGPTGHVMRNILFYYNENKAIDFEMWRHKPMCAINVGTYIVCTISARNMYSHEICTRNVGEDQQSFFNCF